MVEEAWHLVGRTSVRGGGSAEAFEDREFLEVEVSEGHALVHFYDGVDGDVSELFLEPAVGKDHFAGLVAGVSLVFHGVLAQSVGRGGVEDLNGEVLVGPFDHVLAGFAHVGWDGRVDVPRLAYIPIDECGGDRLQKFVVGNGGIQAVRHHNQDGDVEIEQVSIIANNTHGCYTLDFCIHTSEGSILITRRRGPLEHPCYRLLPWRKGFPISRAID